MKRSVWPACSRAGLGFTVFGKVVDKKTLNVIFVSVTSFFGTAIPLIMAFATVATKQDADEQSCTSLTELQLAALETFRLLNASCAYNMTIGPSGVTLL